MGLDSTLEDYKAQTWYPRRFERVARSVSGCEGTPPLEDRLRDEARQRIARHEYELDADRRHDIERIYAAAEHAVSR